MAVQGFPPLLNQCYNRVKEIKIKMKKEDKNKLFEIYQALENAQFAVLQAKNGIKELSGGDIENCEVVSKARKAGRASADGSAKIVEGVFDGENMIGPDGKKYSVPANYASKSKLVEGDILKLTIQEDGTFVYKQIGPVDRTRLIGVLVKDEEGGFKVKSEDKVFSVLTASVTYFKGEAGDEVVILVPNEIDSMWAAIENVIKHLNVKPL